MGYVDFKIVRNSLEADAIIAHYNIKVARRSGDQITVHCPLHDDEKASMGMNATKRVWKCHACDLGGNFLDLVSRLEGHDPTTSEGIRKGALAASEIFLQSSETAITRQRETTQPRPSDPEQGEATANTEACPDPGEYKPLTFQLKVTTANAYLRSRGYADAVLEKYGIGFCNRGLMKGRIVFPLRDVDGELVGYAGRWAGEDIPTDQPRYLFPKGFPKQGLLWNWDEVRVHSPHHLVLVEGFWSTVRLAELGVPVVSCLGHQVSPEQVKLLEDGGVQAVTLLFDGDDPGQAGAAAASALLSKRLWVHQIELETEICPETMDEELLAYLPRFE